MQYYSGRVVKPDQTKLGSTKPNTRQHTELKARLDGFGHFLQDEILSHIEQALEM